MVLAIKRDLSEKGSSYSNALQQRSLSLKGQQMFFWCTVSMVAEPSVV